LAGTLRFCPAGALQPAQEGDKKVREKLGNKTFRILDLVAGASLQLVLRVAIVPVHLIGIKAASLLSIKAVVVVVLAVEVHPELLGVGDSAVVHLGIIAGLHLELLGVVGAATLADDDNITLNLLITGWEVMGAIPQELCAGLELGGMITAKNFSICITIRNDTWVTSIPR